MFILCSFNYNAHSTAAGELFSAVLLSRVCLFSNNYSLLQSMRWPFFRYQQKTR